MKKPYYVYIIVLSVFILTTGIVSAYKLKQPSAPVADVVQSDKLDSECTGNETAGRCADKPPFVCPDDTTPIDEVNHICAPNPPVQAPVDTAAPVTEKGTFGK